MKYFKTLILLVIIFPLSGCIFQSTSESYEKMQLKKGGITGYCLDLRIYGFTSDKNVNEIVRVENYMDSSFRIAIPNIGEPDVLKEEDYIRNFEEVTYKINGVVYTMDETGQYIKTNDKIKYGNPSIYLLALKNIKKNSKSIKEKMGDIIYNTYEVMVDKDTMGEILSDTNISNLEVKKDIKAKIYLNKDGYTYRIIYTIENVTINANYYGINTVSQINVP
jgi:outer membrane lipoprotein-sorting protein